MSNRTILVTGGAGFIGSALIRYLLGAMDAKVVNIDKLTYARNLDSLDSLAHNPHYYFERRGIYDRKAMENVFAPYGPHAVMRLAAGEDRDTVLG